MMQDSKPHLAAHNPHGHALSKKFISPGLGKEWSTINARRRVSIIGMWWQLNDLASPTEAFFHWGFAA
jgi:hypothetical protein